VVIIFVGTRSRGQRRLIELLMPRSIYEFFEAAYSEGYSLQEIYDEAQARMTPSLSPSRAYSFGSDSFESDSFGSDSSETLLNDASPTRSLGRAERRKAPSHCIPGLSRYIDLGPLGMGGMGEVRRVRDQLLGRTLAMKIIHAMALNRLPLVARFREEAQATAQLQHPSIIPIYDVGRLPDGRLWFTMQEVSGHTFGDVIDAVHGQSDTHWGTTPDDWTLHRLVNALRQACEAMAYAHSRAVLHRDLKPSNIMVGRHGETRVLDWGLVKVIGSASSVVGDSPPVRTLRSEGTEHLTVVGHIAGTPAYMPPEQAEGMGEAITAQSDVYALGAILYKVLSGRPPYTGSCADAVLSQVRAGPPAPLVGETDPLDSIGFGLLPDLRPHSNRGLPLPAALVATCEYAMEREPSHRCGSAAELGRELQAWLDGSKRQEAARAVVARSRAHGPKASRLRARAKQLRAEAAELLDGVEAWRPDDAKAAGWEKEDSADELCRQAELVSLEEEQLLQGALTHAPNLVEAHAALANRYRAEHAAAEAVRIDATRAEALFRQHLLALPKDHPDRAGHTTYIKGLGALTLRTDPPNAEVILEQYERIRRRLVPMPLRSLGSAPLRALPLPRGSYRLRLRAPGCVDTLYPVQIERGEHWDGCPPGESETLPIRLPRAGELGPDDCCVPGGWFVSGGDRELPSALPARRVWVDGMIIRRFPVTNRQFLTFLNDLLDQGREADALAAAPRERGGQSDLPNQLVYGRTSDGYFELVPDTDGDLWDLDWPVIMVDWPCAAAYARWESERTGQLWGLPGELAWEKAARGVDGRIYPWGNFSDPSWALSRESHPGRLIPARVDSYPLDESVYGVRGMGGNIRDWCGGPPLEGVPSSRQRIAPVPSLDVPTQVRGLRGGGWGNSGLLLRACYRYSNDSHLRLDCVGFRIARPC